MIVAHYSRHKKEIVESKLLFMTKLKNCKGQEDFCLTYDDFKKMIRSMDLNKIKFNSIYTREKFEKSIYNHNLNNSYKLYDDFIYGTCLTTNPQSERFKEKYGNDFLEFDLNVIKRFNSGYLFAFNVVYKLKDIEQYIYDLASQLYINGEYLTRCALDLTEDNLPDNYENIYNRLFYYLKVLYKKESYEFEKEIRVFIDLKRIQNKEIEVFGNFTHDLNEYEYEKYIKQVNDHLAVNLEKLGINLI